MLWKIKVLFIKFKKWLILDWKYPRIINNKKYFRIFGKYNIRKF